LSDWSISHIAFSQTRKGSFVACNGVCVVTVNWKRHSPLETWTSPPFTRVPPGNGYRVSIATGRARSAFRPHHAFQQSAAMFFIMEGCNHFINRPDAGKHVEYRFSHIHLLKDQPKNRIRIKLLQG
jgi:hypothetical protein